MHWPTAGRRKKSHSRFLSRYPLFRSRTCACLDGPFKHAMELDQQYLLSLDVDRLLHNFRVNAGLPSSAEPLGGWEEPKCELRGHFVGHYLSACALMYASTGDERLKQKGDAVVAGLAQCQAKIGNGYLSAYPGDILRPRGSLTAGLGALLHPAQDLRRLAGHVCLLRQSAGPGRLQEIRRLGHRPQRQAYRRADADNARHRARRHERSRWPTSTALPAKRNT